MFNTDFHGGIVRPSRLRADDYGDDDETEAKDLFYNICISLKTDQLSAP